MNKHGSVDDESEPQSVRSPDGDVSECGWEANGRCGETRVSGKSGPHSSCFYYNRIKKGEDQGKNVTFVTMMSKETDKT